MNPQHHKNSIHPVRRVWRLASQCLDQKGKRKDGIKFFNYCYNYNDNNDNNNDNNLIIIIIVLSYQ